MRIQKDYYTEVRRSSSRLKRTMVVSVVVHAVVAGVLVATAHLWKSAPLDVMSVGVMFAGLPDAPEGVESERVADLPPGPPEAPSVAPPPAPKKEEPKPEPPKPEVKEPEPPKPEPKKPEPKKEEPKKPEPKKPEPKKEEAKKPAPKKEEPKKEEAKKEEPKKTETAKEEKPPKSESLPDAGVDELMREEMLMASAETPAKPGGGLAGARLSNQAQTGLGVADADESGISVRGIPSVLGTWANQVRRAVKRYWQEPGGMPVGSRVAVSFWVSSDGQLLGEPEVAEPSNDATLDQSGINAIKLAAPFPPLPPGYNQSRQQVIFVFTISG